MIAFLITCLTSLGAISGGLISAQSSSLFFFLSITVLCVWALTQILFGRIPIPNYPETLWAAFLVILLGISAWNSPIPSVAAVSWRSIVLGLCIFPAVSLLSEGKRYQIETSILISAWALVLVALFQRFFSHQNTIDAVMPNPNIFAGILILMLPLALARKKNILSFFLALCLLWTHSVGAWLALAIAALFLHQQMNVKMRWSAIAITALCAAAIIRKLSLPDFPNRWIWWNAALKTSLSRPWLGYGPGIFAYLVPLELKKHLLRSLYAHQYYLQTAAECGWPYLVFFLFGIFFFFPKSPMKRLAVLAALLCGFWDYALAVPAIFWLFCYLAASERTRNSKFINLPSHLKPWAAILIIAMTWTLARPAWAKRREENLKLSAMTLLDSGAPISQVHERLIQALAWAPDPDAERLVAESDIKAINERTLSPEQGLPDAIIHLERAVKENPYRKSTWEGLRSLYTATGQKNKAEITMTEERLSCHAP